MLPNLIVPVLNRYDLLNQMLMSIDYPVRDLLIVDNGGDYRELYGQFDLEMVERVRILDCPSNLGVAGSWNLGVKLFPHDRRWFFASNDMMFSPGGMSLLAQASVDELTLAESFPHFQCFALGETVVERIGLFDERFYPAYFEDNDYLRRIAAADLRVNYLPIACEHQNSSTLRSNPHFISRNNQTFTANQELHQKKVAQNDLTWGWDLRRRRAGEWLPADTIETGGDNGNH